MNDDDGYRADLHPVESFWRALADLQAEIEDRRRGDAEAIRRLRAVLASLDQLEAAVVIRARLRADLPEIIETLRPDGPIALAQSVSTGHA